MANITVQVWDATGNKRQDVELPDDAPVGRILAVLLDKMGLPQTGPDDQPLNLGCAAYGCQQVGALKPGADVSISRDQLNQLQAPPPWRSADVPDGLTDDGVPWGHVALGLGTIGLVAAYFFSSLWWLALTAASIGAYVVRRRNDDLPHH